LVFSDEIAFKSPFFDPLIANKWSLISLISLIAWLTYPPFLASAIQDSQEKLKIQTENQKIHIHAKDYPLGKLIQSIHDKTGIQIKIPAPLNTVPVNAKIEAPDWKSAIKKLFQENSRFEMWGKELTTSKIWLYQYENHPVSSGDFIALVDAKETLSKHEIYRLAQEAREINQRLMAMEHFSYLTEDEEVLPLLVFNLQASQAKIRATSLSLFKNLTDDIPLTDIGKIALLDDDPKLRMQALSLIAERVDESDSKPYLLQALNDPSKETQNLAQELLQDLGLSDT
jgi:hypothetical protein